jgi:raffinose/stachyose/melibiose transport system permease protein
MKTNNLLSNKYFVAALFLVPALFFALVYLIIPIPLSAYYSLFKWDGIGAMKFLGSQLLIISN